MHLNLYASIVKEIQISMCIYAVKAVWPCAYAAKHGCILPGLGTYHFSPILSPTRKSGTIRHLENGGNQNFTEAFVTLIVIM